jgi:hypothetical protein
LKIGNLNCSIDTHKAIFVIQWTCYQIYDF